MGVFNSVVADRRHPKLYNMLRSIYQYKYRYRYVGHVSAIERSDLDQALSRQRPIARDEVHHSVWCLLGVPRIARLFSTLPGAALAVFAPSLGNGFCFRFFGQNIRASIRTCMYRPVTAYVYKK